MWCNDGIAKSIRSAARTWHLKIPLRSSKNKLKRRVGYLRGSNGWPLMENPCTTKRLWKKVASSTRAHSIWRESKSKSRHRMANRPYWMWLHKIRFRMSRRVSLKWRGYLRKHKPWPLTRFDSMIPSHCQTTRFHTGPPLMLMVCSWM